MNISVRLSKIHEKICISDIIVGVVHAVSFSVVVLFSSSEIFCHASLLLSMDGICVSDISELLPSVVSVLLSDTVSIMLSDVASEVVFLLFVSETVSVTIPGIDSVASCA